jgi:adenylate cyclase
MPGFKGRVIGNLLLKGKSASLRCYEPLTGDEKAAAGYDKAFALLEAGDAKAKQAFAALVGRDEEDPLAMFHLGRLLSGKAGTEIELSDG